MYLNKKDDNFMICIFFILVIFFINIFAIFNDFKKEYKEVRNITYYSYQELNE